MPNHGPEPGHPALAYSSIILKTESLTDGSKTNAKNVNEQTDLSRYIDIQLRCL